MSSSSFLAQQIRNVVASMGSKRDAFSPATAANAISGDVQLAVSDTFYDGPSVSLGAGTWLVLFHATYAKTGATASQVTARISDGTNHYGSQQAYHASLANITLPFCVAAIVTLASTTTIKGQMATSVGDVACLMKAATPNNASGNTASQITAVRIA